MRILQIDPSLFTAPYDAALSRALRHQGLEVEWATRALRRREDDDLAGERVARFFYPLTDGRNRGRWPGEKALKGIEHLAGLRRIVRSVERGEHDLVHFQWALLPRFERGAIARLRRHVPVAITVHDLRPFNGKVVSSLQTEGYNQLLREADHVFVHGERGRAALLRRGLAADRVSAIAHGPLPLAEAAPEPRPRADRWRIVLFGKLQDYKGADVLIEALGELASRDLARIEVIVAGEALMPTGPLVERMHALDVSDSLELRFGRLDDAAMASLLRSADAFVFPYRFIDASGVLHLVAGLGRWIVASDIGAFRELIGRDGQAGQLVPVGDPRALAQALVASIGRRPAAGHAVPGWTATAAQTIAAYRTMLDRHRPSERAAA